MLVIIDVKNVIFIHLAVTWNRGGREIEDTGRFKFSEAGTKFSFEIPAALATDSGAYTVRAGNKKGSSTWTFTLSVAVTDVVGGDVNVQELLKSMQVSIQDFLKFMRKVKVQE